MQAMTVSAALGRINFEDALANLPASLIYNLGTNAKFDFDHAEYANTENYLIARIPTNGDEGYVYVTQQNDDPAVINAYLVKFIPNTSATGSGFSGAANMDKFAGLAYVRHRVQERGGYVFSNSH